MSFEHIFDENLMATIGGIEMPKEDPSTAITFTGCPSFGCHSFSDC